MLGLAAWVASDARSADDWLVVAGLVVSLVGDVLIESSFLSGLAAFLAAHVLYVAAFLVRTTEPRLPLLVPFLAWAAVVLWRLWPRLGPLRAPVVAYAAVIAGMMWRASATVALPGGVAALAGALLFAASDTLLAFDRFHRPIPGGRWPILLTYWAGQLLIALSCTQS